MNLSWLLASRFRQGKQQNRYISFVSFSSTLGIGLGCFVLIVLLSIMNGFERELQNRLLAVIPHAQLYAVSPQGIVDWPTFIKKYEAQEAVAKVQPYTKLTGMIQQGKSLKAVEITGIDVDIAASDEWRKQVTDQDWQQFVNADDGVLLGQGIIEKLDLHVGDSVSVLIPSVTKDLSFGAPSLLHLTLAGAINMGGELDNLVGMMHLDLASEEAGVTSGAQGLRFTMTDPFAAYEVIRDIGYEFPQAVFMSDWTRTQGHLYDDIKLVRVVVYIALSLVIAVACFNIVSTLVMSVKEKSSAIAILKTMGADDGVIQRTFVFQGLINGLKGITIGTLLAILVAPNLASIVSMIENTLGVYLLSGDIYFIDFLPSELHWQDVVVTVVVALLLCVFATLYPARRAAALKPVSALSR